MASKFTREQIKLCVAKICITMGWHSSMTTPIEILTDVLSNYLLQIGKSTNEYANRFGMTDPNLDHLALAFRDFHVNLSELEEYVKNVDFVDPPAMVPKYPLSKENHMNFLKPGSQEVVTRPVHIHEHLPPMHSDAEVNENEAEVKENSDDLNSSDDKSLVFKRPAEISPGDSFKRPRLLLEDEGRPTREISSVMMTTSGFLSPAREGKLPESRTPITPIDPIPTPPVLPIPPPESNVNKKPVSKLIKKMEKKKDKIGKELFKSSVVSPVKKVANMKDVVKNKTRTLQPNAWNSNSKTNLPTETKFNKALAAARLKTEKLNTTITPIPQKPVITLPPQLPPLPPADQHVDKLFTEPDKRKINILKKISVKNENKIAKVKDEKPPESRESSPDLIIDESMNEPNKIHHLSNDITIELINNVANSSQFTKSPEKPERSYFDDDSPPGTPSTPKTPEMISHSPPLVKGEKRKRKDKSKVRKMQKVLSPSRLDSETELDCPKTPEAHVVVKQEKQEVSTAPPSLPFPFFNHFAGPGLIPPLSNSLFQHLPLPPNLGMPSFGQPAYLPPVHPGMPMNFMAPVKQEEVIRKSPSVENHIQNDASPKDIHNLVVPKVEKKNKEHKKDKKDKIKKKNKKDKIKNKLEKKKLKEEKKDKEKIKKEKREKKKDKEMLKDGNNSLNNLKLTFKLGGGSPAPDQPKLIYKLGESSPTRDQPKLTLKLSSNSESNDVKKLNIKPIVKKEEEPPLELKREMSPELAKISALVTGQPKPKNNPTVTPISADIFPASSNDSFIMKKSIIKPIPKIRTKEPKEELIAIPSSYIEESGKEDGGIVHTTPSPRVGPGPGRPRIHPIKPKPPKIIKQQQTMVKDAQGNKVWICPACGKIDDGSPMIGCDDCDAWYHWICVGIQVEPDNSEDWYCRLCISKKQEVLQNDKKKKRKKREKKQQF